ncbi:hypothetical protein DQ04_11941000 [Trypanosoma grayi]|uniref:hypothetical protein n=1 Tax=Trypanosoma grayi TaxID=71804 RepID=UPI0004F42FB8|nr:hypothetical protein DQ04_11941000 [Trypanosoma grayi]KEG06846.1 hypothetical protein DQ04_11941000 [Trypanosoma grayi]
MMHTRRPVKEEDAFADDLPAGVAVQYRVLQKLLPRGGSERQPQQQQQQQHEQQRRCVPPPAISAPAAAMCGGGSREAALREIERGGPIIDQLLESRAAHARLCALLEERWQDECRALVEAESMQRCFIATTAEWVLDKVLPLVLGALLEDTGAHAFRATVIREREEWDHDMEELRRCNAYLKDCLGEAEEARTLQQKQQEEVAHAFAVSQEALYEARATVTALQQQLKEAEAVSKQPLHSLTLELESLKLQYRELVALHPHRVSAIEKTPMPDGDGPNAATLKAQVEDLRRQLSQKDDSIALLRAELAERRDVARELGASEAKVRTLERRLRAATSSPSLAV